MKCDCYSGFTTTTAAPTLFCLIKTKIFLIQMLNINKKYFPLLRTPKKLRFCLPWVIYLLFSSITGTMNHKTMLPDIFFLLKWHEHKEITLSLCETERLRNKVRACCGTIFSSMRLFCKVSTSTQKRRVEGGWGWGWRNAFQLNRDVLLWANYWALCNTDRSQQTDMSAFIWEMRAAPSLSSSLVSFITTKICICYLSCSHRM